MNVLGVIQEFCKRTAQVVPSTVQSSSDAQIVQMFGLMNEFLEDAATRKGWQKNKIEKTFTSIAAEDQGNIFTLCAEGYQGIVPDTMFDRTQQLPIPGTLDSAEWQARKAWNMSGMFYQYRLRNDKLLFNPALPVSHEIAFEYFSSWFAFDGTTRKAYFTLDSDTCAFPDAVMILWLRYRWKAEKGFEHAAEFQAYENAIAQFGLRDEQPKSIRMDSEYLDARPGVIVPSGSWPL